MPPAAPATIRFTPVDDEPDAEALALVQGGKLLTVKEAMERLRMSRPTITAAMESGELAYFQNGPGGKRLIPERAIDVFIARGLKK